MSILDWDFLNLFFDSLNWKSSKSLGRVGYGMFYNNYGSTMWWIFHYFITLFNKFWIKYVSINNGLGAKFPGGIPFVSFFSFLKTFWGSLPLYLAHPLYASMLFIQSSFSRIKTLGQFYSCFSCSNERQIRKIRTFQRFFIIKIYEQLSNAFNKGHYHRRGGGLLRVWGKGMEVQVWMKWVRLG